MQHVLRSFIALIAAAAAFGLGYAYRGHETEVHTWLSIGRDKVDVQTEQAKALARRQEVALVEWHDVAHLTVALADGTHAKIRLWGVVPLSLDVQAAAYQQAWHETQNLVTGMSQLWVEHEPGRADASTCYVWGATADGQTILLNEVILRKGYATFGRDGTSAYYQDRLQNATP